MLKFIIVLLALLASTETMAQEIATCRNPSGKAFFHFAGLVPKDKAGWDDDKISNGVITLTKIGPDAYDILYVDVNNKPVSSTQDGGFVRMVQKSSDNLTLLVFYPAGTTEIYSFFKEKDGKHRYTHMQSKVGDRALIPKSSLLVGSCDPIRFDRQ
jgi:hypothetical protein